MTEKQREAVTANNNQVLVSAAAGSGKTAVLVERILNLITGEQGVDIDRLLVVTFADAAAGEMSHRLTQALGAEIAKRPTDKNLRRQLLLLGRANITTIHSFCLRVVRAGFHLLDIDPGFKIADTTEIELLKDEVINDLFEEWYHRAVPDKSRSPFHTLVEMYGDKYSDEGLKTAVLELHAFSLGDPNPAEWLRGCAAVFKIKDIEQTPWYEPVVAHVQRVLEGVVFACEKALELCNEPTGPQKYINALEQDKALVREALEALKSKSPEHVFEILQIPLSRLATIPKKDDVEPLLKDLVQSIRNKEIKSKLKSLQNDIFFKPIKEMAQDIKALEPVVDTLVQLTLAFHQNFSKAKQQKNIVDFNDLEHFAIEALRHKEVRDNFTFYQVLTDEYQDSNYIQEFILSAVGHSRFMVGDIKQSIYKFRGAVPELFLSKSQTQEAHLISLSKNFRSGKNVIDTVNFLFEKLMPHTGIVYDEDAKLHQGTESENNSDYKKTEMHIISTKDDTDQELTSMELEARIIAKRIIELKAGGAEYKDIAVLTRAVSGVSDILVGVLTAYGIPSYGESTTGFFETTEIMTILSLLNVIDNPLQDIHIIAVLKSPLYDIDVNDLVKIRQISDEYFFDCIHNIQEEEMKCSLGKFTQDLDDFRNMAKYKPVDQLITSILAKTGYHHYIQQTKGQGALSNINMLIEIAARQQSKSLYHFVQHIERLKRRSITIGEARTQSAQDAVAVMSIHKSKGLEYPVVFVAGMGRRFNFKDKQKDLMLHRQYGFGPKFIDINKRIKYPTIASIAISNAIHTENLAEEIRILYVATTRAKNHLILMGTTSASQEKWQLPYNHLSAISFLDMIMPIIKAETKKDTPFEIFEHESAEIDLEQGVAGINTVTASSDLPANTDATQPLKVTNPLPSSISITEIKGNYYKNLAYEQETNNEVKIITKPKFLNPSLEITPVNLGNIHHTVMEHLRIGDNNISALLDSLIHKNHLTEQEVAVVNIEWISAFLESPLARRMGKASYVKRETHFAMNIHPHEAYLQGEGDIVVHGIIDAYFEEDTGLVIVDYKTDNIRQNATKTIKERYKIQMQIYKKALENIVAKPVTQSIIYLLPTGEEIII
ncbi:MAG: helicase-exonuclease AddAB subunit AddA [Defluviitaleaceae bacterium]|nr:helicase-exonuclease AddAB subunit AddA [Defluviitaleaceae bacterium]